MEEHIFGEFALAHHTFGSCTSPTDTFTSPTTCAVDDFQRLRYGNSQSPEKFTEKPRIQIIIYIYIAQHLRVKWHSLVYHIRPSINKGFSSDTNIDALLAALLQHKEDNFSNSMVENIPKQIRSGQMVDQISSEIIRLISISNPLKYTTTISIYT